MSVEIQRQRIDVCVAIFADELNDFYGGSPFVEVVTIDDNFDITITYDVTPSAQNLTDLDTLLAAHDCSLIDDEEDAGQPSTFDVYNNTGSTILTHTPVYITGFDVTNNVPTVAPADASDPLKMPAIGVVCRDAIDVGDIGLIVYVGPANIVDTSSYTLNDFLYVAPGGGLATTIKPTGTNLVQKITQVTRVDAINGTFQVFGVGRSNDLPNLTTNTIWIGDVNSVAELKTLNFQALADVNVPSPTSGNILQFDGSNWGAVADTSFWDTTGSTLHLDSAISGNNVGIGNTSADEKLHVTGNIKGTSQIYMPKGSTAVPSYSFTDDIDTGWYQEPSGDVGLSMNGVCTFEVTTTNRIIISTQVPNYENLVTADNVIPNKKYVDDAISSSGGGMSGSIYTLQFARDTTSGNVWLSHALTANDDNNPEYSNVVPAIIPFDSVLVGITFSNDDTSVDCGVEIKKANVNNGRSDSTVFDWVLSNVRVARKTNGLSGVTFSAGDKVGIFIDDHGTNPDDPVVILYLKVTDSSTGEGSENYSGDF